MNRSEIRDSRFNPLIVHAEGQGAVAVGALVSVMT
jgi:hypothetical protein